jgi:hypothetical protein
MKLLVRIWLIVVMGSLTAAGPAIASDFLIENVTIVDVESGTHRTGQSLLMRNGTIEQVGAAGKIKGSRNAIRVQGAGKFLIPGLWDMHVHSHRERRWTYHYPLYRAFGVVGVRDAGSHLGSALVARERARSDPLAPRVIWGSPIIDGAPAFNTFGLSAEDGDSGRVLVREVKRLGFDFVKVYDRLTPSAYAEIASESRRLGMRLEGHVPLALSPTVIAQSGQTVIDHLTLVLEACLPGQLEAVHAAQQRNPDETDASGLMMEEGFAAVLARYDGSACDAQFRLFADKGVWQVPTLVQMRGYFHADDPVVTSDPRTDLTSPLLLAEWKQWAADNDPARLANGRKVLAAQMRLIRAMADRGVGLLAGTDTSNEPWVFAGASLHDELGLFVAAGLTPAEALRTATLNPLLYQGRKPGLPIISKGERADLVLLDADPLVEIGNTRKIAAVFARGQLHDRAALDALLARARTAAADRQ